MQGLIWSAYRSGASNRRAALEPLERRRLLTSVVVNTIADSTDAPNSVVVSLRDAIRVANSSSTATTITFSPTIFAVAQTITLSGAELEFSGTQPITLTGPAAGVTVNGNQQSRVFLIDPVATVSVSRLTVTDGISGEANTVDGGGIENRGALTLFNVQVLNNFAGATFGSGGGIDNTETGTVNLTDCTVSGNTTDFYGTGGGINNSGLVDAIDSTISGNSSGPSDSGGGIESGGSAEGGRSGGNLILTGCTISGNTGGSNGGGGGLFLGSGATLTNCTIANNSNPSDSGGGIQLYLPPGAIVTVHDCTLSGNSAAGGGGGIDNFVLPNPHGGANYIGGECDIANTIIAGNTAGTGPDVMGAFHSTGGNFISRIDASTGWITSDQTGTVAVPINPQLSVLGNHGGPTQTLVPLPTSPVIGAGLAAQIPAGITLDQRGLPRVVHGKVDVGAVEVQSSANTGTVSGSVFFDKKNAGVFQRGDVPLAGRYVYVDLNYRHHYMPGDPIAVTDASGNYTLTHVPTGGVAVRQLLPGGWYQTTPGAGTGLFANVSPGGSVTLPAFGEGTAANLSISGSVFNDLKPYYAINAADPGLSGWTVYIDTNNSGKLSAADPTAITDAHGNFSFTGLLPGSYVIRVVPRPGYQMTAPKSGNSFFITVTVGRSVNDVRFGEHQIVAPVAE